MRRKSEAQFFFGFFLPRQPLSNRGVNLLTAQSYRSGLVINCEQCTGHSCEVKPAEQSGWAPNGGKTLRGARPKMEGDTRHSSAVSWYRCFATFFEDSTTRITLFFFFFLNWGGLHQQSGCNKDKYVGQLTCVWVAGARSACGVSPSSRLTAVLVCVWCMNGFMKLLRNHPKVFWHTSAPLLSFISAANWHHKWLQGFYGHQL